MKKVILLITASFCLANSYAQTAEEKAWAAFMTPGPEQQMLAKQAGTWNEEITMYMDATAAPMKMNLVCVNEMLLGGRYQRSTSKGEMMGQQFEGVSTMAYDNGRKIWISTWIDNMGTGITYAEGTYDAGKKAITVKGKMTNPSTGKPDDFTQVFTTIDDDHQKIEMFSTLKGKQFKNMEIILTRQK